MEFNLLKKFLDEVEIYSAHEHIGSLTSFGIEKGQYFFSDLCPGMKPNETTLMEIIFDPYFAGVIIGLGFKFPSIENNSDESIKRVFIEAKEYIENCAGTGLYEALNIAFKELYSMDFIAIFEENNLILINNIIKQNYVDYYKWFNEVMERTNTKKILKPVHPEYITRMEKGEGQEEHKWTIPILRVDSLVGSYDNNLILDFYGVEKPHGKEINNIDDLEETILWFFNLVDKNNIKAVKQLQAYSRHLNHNYVSRDSAALALENIMDLRGDNALVKGKSYGIEVQDYILRRILEESNKRKLTYQIHTGMTNLFNSNPALLEENIINYPSVNFTLLHCYPYISEVAYLARCYSNVTLDTSWLALQSPAILEKAFNEYIGFVPYERVTISIDATSLENYYGGVMLTKKCLYYVLCDKINKGYINQNTAINIINSYFGENFKRLYI